MVKVIPKFYGKVVAGHLHVDDEPCFRQYLYGLKGIVEVVVKNLHSTRSNQQNRYYWGVVVKILCDETGYDQESMHEILKDKFLQIKTQVFNEVVDTSRSTTSLNTVEMNEYLENIQRWAAENGTIIPDPDEVEI